MALWLTDDGKEIEEDYRKDKNPNPKDEPTGHYTGRCENCGSNDLWDDNLHYGCNNCGAFLA